MARTTSWYIPLDKKLSVKEIALFGMLGGLTFGAKLAMAGLPNIEPVSLLVMLFAVTFGAKCLFPIYVYVAMELILFPIGDWSLMYLYLWALLALGAWCMRRTTQPLGWALLSGAFGLFFEVLGAPVYVLYGGFSYAVAKCISGILYSLLHCAGNFVLALLLFNPLRKLLTKLYQKL